MLIKSNFKLPSVIQINPNFTPRTHLVIQEIDSQYYFNNGDVIYQHKFHEYSCPNRNDFQNN